MQTHPEPAIQKLASEINFEAADKEVIESLEVAKEMLSSKMGNTAQIIQQVLRIVLALLKK